MRGRGRRRGGIGAIRLALVVRVLRNLSVRVAPGLPRLGGWHGRHTHRKHSEGVVGQT